MDTTLDIARRCPRCEHLGEIIRELKHRNGSVNLQIMCRNERCRWCAQEAPWIVDIMPNGEVAKPKPHIKSYPERPDYTDRIREQIDRDIKESLER